MVVLVASDNEQFVVDSGIMECSTLIKAQLEGSGRKDQIIRIPNVNSSVLKEVLEYCEHHRGLPLSSPDGISQDEARWKVKVHEWDKRFMAGDHEMLFEIILAANYLGIKPLLDVGCKIVADMIQGKTPGEIKKIFNIVVDFTPEEAQIRKENEWVDD